MQALSATQLLFWGLMILFGVWVVSVFVRALDKHLGVKTIQEAKVTNKREVLTEHFDLNLHPIMAYYVEISLDNEKRFLRVSEEVYDKIHVGESYDFEVVIGRSGEKYPNKLA